MGAPTTDGDDTVEDLKEDLEERAAEVLKDGEYLTFEEHSAKRE